MSNLTERLEIISIDKLIPYENNARTHSEEQINKIQASLREFGFVNPVLIDKDYGIIAGHGRVEAAKRNGMSAVPCVLVEHLNDAQKKAYILADSRLAELAGWDEDLLRIELKNIEALGIDTTVIGFDFEDIDDIDTTNAEEDNYINNPSNETYIKKGDIYKLGKHRLMCGDSSSKKDVELLVNGAEIDLLITDPPYNVNYNSEDGKAIVNDNMESDAFYKLLSGAFINADHVMKEGAAFYIWHASRTASEFEKAIKSAGWDIRQQLIWIKNSLVLGRQDYQWIHEPCFYGWKDGAAHYFIYDRTLTTKVWEDINDDINKISKERLMEIVKHIYSEMPLSVIYENKPSKSESHPTMKPVKLIERLIKNSSKQHHNVLDIFGGSGTTLITCEQLNRVCYMMEIDPKYCGVIIERWEQLTGSKAVKL